MATLEEQETIITLSRVSDTVSVYTSSGPDIRHFSKNPAFTKVREWFDAETGEVEAAEFTLPRERANIRKIVKGTRNLSDEQRKAVADRLSAARNQN